jgi:hypothetical protein
MPILIKDVTGEKEPIELTAAGDHGCPPSREDKIDCIHRNSGGTRDVLDQYDFLKEGLHQDDPRIFKMMELVNVSRVDVVSHNPGATAIKNNDKMIALRENADDLTLKMAIAMLKTVDQMSKNATKKHPAGTLK